ncbi:hypothetical protein FB45DRAFT_957578 [Roridomyces roridus]|uniref:Uncharacterized protein n=1 Tax=Roridomyces roridus TaxID=1738132 RepID=A0AAD7AYD5_9AGAR|nr:hypothetical protein FB45DRAFT_957578 [Roridomyces roridus]
MAHDLTMRDSVDVARTSFRYAFYGLQLAGLSGAFLLLLTASIWRKATRRHASWYNFMICWIISCSSYIFLIGLPLGKEPDQALCAVQAALIYAVPPLTAGATIALVIHVYMTLRSLLVDIPHRQLWTAALVIGPYIPAWILFLVFLNKGLSDPSLVRRMDDGTYCSMSMNTQVPARASSAVVSTIMILCLGVEAIIFRNLRRVWAIFKQDSDERASVSMVVRVLAFTSIGMLSIILSMIFMILPDSTNEIFNIVIAIVPVSSILIFGTQKDILAAWTSTCRRERENHHHEQHHVEMWETFTPTGSSNLNTRSIHPPGD